MTDRLARWCLVALPPLVTALLLLARGGVLLSALSLALGLSVLLLLLPMERVLRRAAYRPLGALDAFLPAALGVYLIAGLAGVYPASAIPAVGLALLCFAVFRAAAALEPAEVKGSAFLAVTLPALAAASATVVCLAGGGPATAPAAWPLVDHNHLASIAGAALPLALVVAWEPPQGVSPLIARGAAAVLGIGLAFSVSRAGIAAGTTGVLATALLLLLSRRSRPLLGAAAVGLLVLLGFAIAAGPLAARLAGQGLLLSASERLAILQSSLAAAKARPLLGWGAGAFRVVFPAFRDARVPYQVEHAHCDLVELLVESGAIGVLAALAVLLAFAREVARPWQRPPGAESDRPLRRLSLAAAIGVGVLLLHGLADFPLRLPAVAALGSWLAGLSLAAGDTRRTGARSYRPEPERRPARALRLALLSGFALLVAVATFSALEAGSAVLSRSSDPRWVARAPALAPFNAGAWRGRGDLLLASGLAGDPTGLFQAFQSYDIALRLDPFDPAAHVTRGRLSLLFGDDPSAQRDFREAIRSDPAAPAWRLAAVGAFLASHREEEALSAGLGALEAEPTLAPQVLQALAAGIDDSLLLERALPPGDAPSREVLAGILEERGKAGQAAALRRDAAGLDPSHFGIPAAEHALAAGDPAGARALLEKALGALAVRCDPPSAADPVMATRGLLLRSRLEIQGHSLGEARTDAGCAEALSPQDPAPRVAAAEAARAAGDFAAAEGDWEEAARLSPSDPGPLLALSSEEEDRGKWEAALESARRAEDRRTCEGAGVLTTVRILKAHGLASEARGRLDELAKVCGPDSPVARARDTLAAGGAP